ncbi:MAG: hypothetical protein FWC50_01040 [Planctomycetaceae bacterium]|nr:hypothetical protein [Planctomycetaceae bacterium]
MGSSNPGDGVPKGTYKVSIQDVMQPTVEPTAPGKPPKLTFPKTLPIDKKYIAGNTSGLTCEVKGRTTFNIEVTPPAETSAKKK